MHKKVKINVIVLIAWVVMILIYHIVQHYLEIRQLEYREWVNSWYIILLCLLPLFLIGWNLWRKYHLAQEKKKLWGTIFGSYCIVGILIFLFTLFFYALLHDTSETTLTDGNYRVRVSCGYENEYYYAEPIYVFARRRFEWTTEKYEESLSKTYDAKFRYIGDDESNHPQFISSEYENVIVTVYGIDDHDTNALDEDLRYMVTSSRLEQKWDTFFTNGEELVLDYRDFYHNNIPKNPVYAVVVYEDKIEETARDLAAFIKNECETAVRADGKALYANIDGSIFLFFQRQGDSDYISTRNIPYGKIGLWSYDESVTAADILSELNEEFRHRKSTNIR